MKLKFNKFALSQNSRHFLRLQDIFEFLQYQYKKKTCCESSQINSVPFLPTIVTDDTHVWRNHAFFLLKSRSSRCTSIIIVFRCKWSSSLTTTKRSVSEGVSLIFDIYPLVLLSTFFYLTTTVVSVARAARPNHGRQTTGELLSSRATPFRGRRNS